MYDSDFVVKDTRVRVFLPVLMVSEGRDSKTKKGRIRGTLKFVRNLERFSHSACAPSLSCGQGLRSRRWPFFI